MQTQSGVIQKQQERNHHPISFSINQPTKYDFSTQSGEVSTDDHVDSIHGSRLVFLLALEATTVFWVETNSKLGFTTTIPQSKRKKDPMYTR